MMTASCDDIRTLLIDHQEGELSPDARARVDAHLRECGSCAGEAALLAEALSRARALPVSEPAPEFWGAFQTSLRRRLLQEPAPRLSVWVRARRAVAHSLRPAPALAAATALALLLGIGLVRTPRPQEGRGPIDAVMMGDDLRIGQNLELLQQLDVLEELDVLERLPLVLPAA